MLGFEVSSQNEKEFNIDKVDSLTMSEGGQGPLNSRTRLFRVRGRGARRFDRTDLSKLTDDQIISDKLILLVTKDGEGFKTDISIEEK